MLDAQVFKSSFNRSNLYYEVRPKVDPTKDIIKFIKNNEGKSVLSTDLSRKKVEELTEVLWRERNQGCFLPRRDGASAR